MPNDLKTSQQARTTQQYELILFIACCGLLPLTALRDLAIV